MPEIGIITGSDSDLPKIADCFNILEEFGVEFEIIISSAHRTPEQTKEWAGSAAVHNSHAHRCTEGTGRCACGRASPGTRYSVAQVLWACIRVDNQESVRGFPGCGV